MAWLRIVTFLFLIAEFAHADVGLICALKGEMEQLVEDMTIESKNTKAEREFYAGTIDGVRVILVRSPMGKVNNAITAQLLVSNFHVDTIVSIGFAGAVGVSAKKGDVIVSNEALQHDFGTIKPYGFLWEKAPDIGESSGGKIEKWMASNGYIRGIITSGDQFIASEEKREWLRSKFNAFAVDMGSAAVYEVCKQNGIQCLFIRVISDYADIEGRISFTDSVRDRNFGSVSAAKRFLIDHYAVRERRHE